MMPLLEICNFKKIQYGGDRHFKKKSKNCHISAAVSAISTKFGTVTQFYLLDRLDRYK